MTALELSNNLDKHYDLKKKFPQTVDDVVSMLRKQQAEIEELKNARDYWCLQYKDVFNKLESIANERCNGK
jgi:DNA repair ATPase RecN